jgi:hypothetical protein
MVLDRFRRPEMAVSHALVELWEAILFAIGFNQVLGLGMVPALDLGPALGGTYVALAMLFVR